MKNIAVLLLALIVFRSSFADNGYSNVTGLNWLTSVANVAALPASGNSNGDARVTLNDQSIYVWKQSSNAWLQTSSPDVTIGSYYVDKGGSDSSTCGRVNTPCLTIQKSLDNIGNSASVADFKSPKTVFIGGGVYDESLSIPHGRILTLTAVGTVILGNGLGANWSSTNSRNVTATWNSADVFGSDLKPALNINAIGASDSTSTFIAEAGNFRISGNLVIAGDGLSSTLNLYSTVVDGQMNQTTSGLVNVQMYRSIVKGTVNMGTSAILERCEDSQFDALLTVNSYNAILNSEIRAGMTVTANSNTLPPSGFFHTTFTGVFTGPASSLKLDPSSEYFFRTNGATLGGSATKVYQYGFLPNGTQPTCVVGKRGLIWNVEGGAGVADELQVCQKNASDAYVWVTK